MSGFIKILALVVGILLYQFTFSSAATLSRIGGYDLVIAIDESTTQPEDVVAYRDNIEQAFQLFSRELFFSTRERFHINSVDLLVPESWQMQIPSEIATFQAYQTADFKISQDYDVPRVENPNVCGARGQHVELPVDFFNRSRISTRYGSLARSILNLFARYRFGVWEEHGEINNNLNFPYFHIKPSLVPEWTFTGCSENIQGSIQDENGEQNKNCETFSEHGPQDNCRFVPSPTNSVNSSLAFFPWANSISRFCDETTHSYDSPNRHNLFCGHRSVWEVIRESEDYFSTLGRPLNSIPVPRFRVVKTSSHPLFYILLDRGRTQTSVAVLNDVAESLQDLLQNYISPEVITAVGTFPHSINGRSHSYVRDEAEWSTIETGFNNFSYVIDNTLEHNDGPVVRDFGLSIQEVAENIRARRHKAGAVILVVKRGATQNGFEQLTYFGDVLSTLRNQNIRLYAIEFQQNVKTPYVNLQQLVTQTDGRHHVVNTTTDVRNGLKPFFEQIKQTFDNGLQPSNNARWTIFKGYIGLNRPFHVPIYDEQIGSLTLCVTTKRFIPESDIEIRQVKGTVVSFDRSRRDEWDEIQDIAKRTVTIATIQNPPANSEWEIIIRNCTSLISDDCVAFLVANIEAERETKVPSSLLEIDVLTSAENNYLDFDRRGAKLAPFSIFAKIEIGGQRVLNLESVTATLVYDNSRYFTLPLLDNGLALPDVSAQDGIYSSTFTPPQNGIYKIYVTVSHQLSLNEVALDEEEPGQTVNLLGQLIPIDQSQFGCNGSASLRCVAASVGGYLSRTEDLIGTIFVENTITFSPRPMRIMDFTVTTLPNHIVRFGFTSPRVLGIDTVSVDEFNIYLGSNASTFSEGTDNAQLIVQRVGLPPGTQVEIEYDVQSEAVYFFAVESVFRTQRGGPSNVVGSVITQSGTPPVPKPTTTTTTEVPPTTILSTGNPIPSTTTTRSPSTLLPTTKNPITQTTTQASPTTTTQRSEGNAQFFFSPLIILISALILFH